MGHLWGILANCGLKSSGEGNKFIRELQDGSRSEVFDGDCAEFWGSHAAGGGTDRPHHGYLGAGHCAG